MHQQSNTNNQHFIHTKRGTPPALPLLPALPHRLLAHQRRANLHHPVSSRNAVVPQKQSARTPSQHVRSPLSLPHLSTTAYGSAEYSEHYTPRSRSLNRRNSGRRLV
ncbi:unnamed protein product [Periconia digitata]|uniref:Uncharacterized protein n=1 Tax=Periconia digitata TaxID=1303443 RepID=A0A9W4UAA4_9PLEO|nr:unnamed protein product [Periconia digitata]